MRKLVLIFCVLAFVAGCSPAPQPVVPASLPTEMPTVLPTDLPTAPPTTEQVATDVIVPTDVPPTALPAPAQLTTDQQTAAQGILDSVCSVCHSPDKVKGVQADQAGWARIITGMQSRGAAIQDADIQLLAQYLASNP
jgi:mono/diheme cytochrome c family protein